MERQMTKQKKTEQKVKPKIMRKIRHKSLQGSGRYKMLALVMATGLLLAGCAADGGKVQKDSNTSSVSDNRATGSAQEQSGAAGMGESSEANSVENGRQDKAGHYTGDKTDLGTESSGAEAVWGGGKFTKEEVQERLDAGLSEIWENYQVNACLAAMDNLPENVLSSLEAAVGAYRWENYRGSNIQGRWEDYRQEPDIVGQKLHALFDLYGITPDTVFPAIGKAELEKRVADNPKMDMAQYATYEDGDAFLPYFSYYGSEILAENTYIKVEGPRDITVEWYEDISRVVRITNKSEQPVYIEYAFWTKRRGAVVRVILTR